VELFGDYDMIILFDEVVLNVSGRGNKQRGIRWNFFRGGGTFSNPGGTFSTSLIYGATLLSTYGWGIFAQVELFQGIFLENLIIYFRK
jgi:hypothetical protein